MIRYFTRGTGPLRHPVLGLVLAAIPILAVGFCGSSAAFAATNPTTLTLSVSTQPQHSATLTLVSDLKGGSDVAGKSVAFYVVSTEFMPPVSVPIGTAETAANGSASINYKPTWSGKEKFIAEVTSAGVQVPEATAEFLVTNSTPGPLYATANPARPLGFIGRVFTGVILSIVAAVWLSLLFILFLMARALPRLASRQDERRVPRVSERVGRSYEPIPLTLEVSMRDQRQSFADPFAFSGGGSTGSATDAERSFGGTAD